MEARTGSTGRRNRRRRGFVRKVVGFMSGDWVLWSVLGLVLGFCIGESVNQVMDRNEGKRVESRRVEELKVNVGKLEGLYDKLAEAEYLMGYQTGKLAAIRAYELGFFGSTGDLDAAIDSIANSINDEKGIDRTIKIRNIDHNKE